MPGSVHGSGCSSRDCEHVHGMAGDVIDQLLKVLPKLSRENDTMKGNCKGDVINVAENSSRSPAVVAIDQGDSSRDHAFSGGERDALRLLKDVVFSNGLMRSHPAEFLETLSTVVFFFVNKNDYSHDSLVRKVKKIKPHLSKRILSVAVNVAKELLLSVNPPTATMVEEVKAWERMGDGLDKDITDPPGNGEKTTLLDPYKT